MVHAYVDGRQADLFDISNATDIHGTLFDDPSNPIADDGKLDKSITPATYVGFVSLIDSTQLGRFGVHNGEWISTTIPASFLMHSSIQASPRIRRS